MKKLFKLLLIVGLSMSSMAMDESKTGCEDGYNVDCRAKPELCEKGEQSEDPKSEGTGATEDKG